MRMENTALLKLFSLTVIVAVLCGCGGNKNDGTTPTQVVAKVNGSEISVHQVNALMGSRQFPSTDAADQARLQALNKLIEQQLAYDQALERKLDRTPDVVMAIESMKREIVARAYLEQVLSGLSEPSKDEIRDYYRSNPALFSNRKIYTLQELAVEPKAEILDELKAKAASGATLEEIAEWLKSQNVEFRSNAVSRAAEQIGLELLPQVAQLKDGEMTVFQGPKNYLVVRVAASKLKPIGEQDAQARISQFLRNKRAREMVAQEIRRLKEEATIEYVGEIKPADAGAQSNQQETTSVKMTGPAVTAVNVVDAELNIGQELKGFK